MRKLTFFLFSLLVVAVCSCGGKKKDVAYYEAQIDSIRKAQQLRQMKQAAGVYDDPVEKFFDTLQLRTLPIRSAGDNLVRMAHFSRVPRSVASLLDYPVETPLRMVSLPRAHGFFVGMLAEGPDSIAPIISLVVLDKTYQLVDELCIYEQKEEERGDDRGILESDYYITSDYEITVMTYFRKLEKERLYVDQTRRYIIDKEGHFEEVIVDYE